MNECMYCMREGELRVSKSDGLDGDVYVCGSCWKLLKNPVTALPLLRGFLVTELRGQVPSDKLEDAVNKFMDIVSKWKPRQ